MPAESDRQVWPTVTPADVSAQAPTGDGQDGTLDPSQRTGPHLETPRPDHPDPPNTFPPIPGYVLESILGRGGMGIVYRARQTKVDRLVALKMILGSRHASARDLVRFQIEAESVARLQHPHIVQIHEIGEYEGNPFFSLEYCEGGNLGSRLKKQLPSPSEAARLLATLAQAMHYAHLRGVVHRDLKPVNILLDSAGQPKIADFGLAKRTDSDSDFSQSGAILGTPSYMAPEQAAGKVRDTGPAADVYALGAILYELLTGKPPFQGESSIETIQKVLNEEPVRPSRVRPGVPRDLETICLKCLQKEPASRYASSGDLVDELNRFLEDRPIQARPAGIVEKIWRWCRRSPARATLIAAVCLLLLGVVIVSSLLAYREHQAKREVAEYNQNLLREQKEKDAALKSALSGAARLALDRGLMLCEQGDVPRGMLTFAKALSIAIEAGDTELESVTRFNVSAWEREMWRLQSFVLAPKDTYVLRAVLNPQNKLMAVSLANKTAQIWDKADESGRRILHTLPHDGIVIDLTFSSDGKLLMTRTERTVSLWNVADGTQACPTIAHGPKILGAALSPDSKFVVTGAEDKTARFWNAQTGGQEGIPLEHKFAVSIVAIDGSGKQVLTSSAGRVQVFDVASRAALGRELTHKSLVRSATFSPDGLRVLTGTLGKTVHVWGLNDRTEIFSALNFDDPVEEVLFNPDGDTIAVRTMTGSAYLRQADTGAPIGSVVPHPGIVYHIAFSRIGKRFLTAGNNGIVRIWDTTPDGMVTAVLHHPNQNRLLAGSCSFSSDGQTVLTVDGTVRLWQAPKGSQRGTPIRHAGGAYAIAFSNDGKWVLSGGDDGKAILRNSHEDVYSDRVLKTGAPIAAVMFSPDGQLAAVADFKGTIHLWEVKTGLHKQSFQGHNAGVNSAAFSPDNTTILTVSTDKTARLWNAHTGQPLGQPLVHEGMVNAAAFSQDGRFAYTAELNGFVRQWDVATGASLSSHWSQAAGVHAIATSSDGRFVITGSGDKSARIWNSATGEAVGVPFLHQDTVRDVKFSSDSLTVLTGSFDKTARRWHTATGIPIGSVFKHLGRVRSVALSADRRTAATASWDGAATLWETPDALAGSPDLLNQRIRLATGIEMDEHFTARSLDAQVWFQLRANSVNPDNMNEH